MGQADITNAMENLSSSSAGSGMGSLGGLFLALKSVSCASTLSALPMFLFDDDDDDDEENKDGSRKELFFSLSLSSIKMYPDEEQYNTRGRCEDPDFFPPHTSLHVSIDVDQTRCIATLLIRAAFF